MTRHLLAGVAVLQLLAIPAAAQEFSPHGRFIEFGGVTWAPEADDEVYNFGIGTSLDVPFTDTLGIQLDASIFGLASPGTASGGGDGAITAYHRNDEYGVGVFASGLSVDGFVVYGGGLSGLLYTDNVTYFGSLEVLDGEGASDPIVGGALGGTYFLSPDTALIGQSSVGFDTGPGSNVLLGLGLGAEHRFTGTRLSLGADYSFTAATGNGSSVIHSAGVNLNYHFGSDTLLDESRDGPGFPGGFSVLNLFGGR